jgi:hypothetical protein
MWEVSSEDARSIASHVRRGCSSSFNIHPCIHATTIDKRALDPCIIHQSHVKVNPCPRPHRSLIIYARTSSLARRMRLAACRQRYACSTATQHETIRTQSSPPCAASAIDNEFHDDTEIGVFKVWCLKSKVDQTVSVSLAL